MLIIVILSSLGIISYVIARQKVDQKYTEFYLLGMNSQASDYPTNFTLENGQVVSVAYGNSSTGLTEKWGQVTVCIVNHEGQDTAYNLTMEIEGSQVGIPFQGSMIESLGPINLLPEEKWEQEIGILPQHMGDNQEVELFLYKDSGAEPYLNLILWISVK